MTSLERENKNGVFKVLAIVALVFFLLLLTPILDPHPHKNVLIYAAGLSVAFFGLVEFFGFITECGKSKKTKGTAARKNMLD